ncbi:hypothetical protein IMG5_186630 [Ichthyophthirius multifiliis]|uniref:Uncharacterized protein n=1 Tax=Ichthyophthirius multifiliis TaxID=5932 RepID=G0R3M8_ICHMU|nr:hypothetical protein IMG5_186630 [Ichthyophthirius multifiliis]EGR27911.1 hypothetical protein IMG5_186630 [Ichthyophthirius multifiliis]|eukprot:XP_004027256.1 hypothetical protein IMG5_186630 [Ichthyophthirius multifiliis]
MKIINKKLFLQTSIQKIQMKTTSFLPKQNMINTMLYFNITYKNQKQFQQIYKNQINNTMMKNCKLKKKIKINQYYKTNKKQYYQNYQKLHQQQKQNQKDKDSLGKPQQQQID